MLAIFIAAGCMPQIINEQPGPVTSRAITEPNRQEAPSRKEPRTTLTEGPIAVPAAPIRATRISTSNPAKIHDKDEAAPTTNAASEIQKTAIHEIASSQTGSGGPQPAPAESHAISGSNDELFAVWPAVFILAIGAALLLLVARLIGKRSVHISPEKPLAKLLHTRPWR
jgi:hypothetical protein